MPIADDSPATKKDLDELRFELRNDLKESEERLKNELRTFITGDFRDQYINDMRVLNEQLIGDFNGIFADRTEQHTDRLDDVEQDVFSIKLALGMTPEGMTE